MHSVQKESNLCAALNVSLGCLWNYRHVLDCAAIVSEYKRRGGRGSGAYFGTLGPGYLFTGDMDRAKSGEGGGIISGTAYNRQFMVFFSPLPVTFRCVAGTKPCSHLHLPSPFPFQHLTCRENWAENCPNIIECLPFTTKYVRKFQLECKDL